MKRMLVLFVMLVLIPGLLVFPADVVKKSTNVTTVKGTVRNMMDANMPSLDQLSTPRRMRPVMNFESPRKIKMHSTEPDSTIVEPTLNPKTPKDVTVVAGFAGMNLTSNGAGWPPDTNGAIGPNHYVETVNTSIGIYNKSTGAKISTTTFNNFFGGAGITGTPCDANNNGDPIVLYDRYAQRWILFDFCWYSTYSGGSWFAVAASQTSDPTGAWYQYAFNADTVNMNDYPKAGVWHDGIYVTANMFSFSSSAFLGVKTWVWKKPDIYNGTLTSLSVMDTSYYAWSLLPSNAVGTTAPTGPNYLFSIDADEYGSPSTDAIPWWTCAVNWTTNTLTWTYKGVVAVSAYSIVSTGVPQKGTTKKLDSLYGRPMYSAIYREPGKAYLCHVAEANSCRSTRYYELNVSTSSLTIARQATLACTDALHRWMASICADKNGDIALGYSVSSSAKYPSIYVRDVIAGTETQVKAGAGYQKTYTRWGDYSMMDIDATDDETFWYTNEYYAASGTNWQTWIAHFKI
ncbi:MAG: hypothetical protein NT166_08785 [Candidatus Aminicenantes bacterium]|nr:hypothetical protein [Candidatus Aminicenantes bacterium]